MEPKRFYRSRNDKVFAGVCGGLSEYFDVDPLLIRLLFVVLALVGGGGFLLYIILWIVAKEEPVNFTVPKEPPANVNQEPPKEEPKVVYDAPNPGPAAQKEFKPRRRYKGLIGGLVLITLGILFLVQEFVETVNFGDLWPILLVVIGLGLVVISVSEKKAKS